MTVGELIAQLQQCPDGADVLIEYDSFVEPLSVLKEHKPCVILFHRGYGSQAERLDYTQQVEDYLEKKAKGSLEDREGE